MTSAQGIRFDLRASDTLTGVLTVLVAITATVPMLTSLPWTIRWLLSAGLAAHGIHTIRQIRQMPFRALAWTWDDVWLVTDRRGLVRPAELVGFRTVGVSVFLQLRWRGGAGRLALLPDNTPPDDLRILRARLAGGA
jgi:hypothetical protein